MARNTRMEWILVSVVTAVCWGSAARAEDLVAAAHQEKARRAMEERLDTRRGEVFTGADLKKYEGQVSHAGKSEAPAVSTAAQEPNAASAAEEAEADKAYWDVEIDAARVALDRAESSARDAEDAVREAREATAPETYDDALAQAAEVQSLVNDEQAARRDLQEARDDYNRVASDARESNGTSAGPG